MPLARRARVTSTELHVDLRDGRHLVVPLREFRVLELAPRHAREKVTIMRPGIGLVWRDINFDLGVGGLVRQATEHGTVTPARPKRPRRR
jgi:hypothetical protein